jgi:hypothetical protein
VTGPENGSGREAGHGIVRKMVQVYVDESGLDGRSPWLVFSALMGTASDWAAVSKGWREALAAPPAIAYFKMSEAAKLGGEFRRFSAQERDDKLVCLARAVHGEYPILELKLTCDVGPVSVALKHQSRKPADNPYFWCFHLLTKAVGLALADVNYDEPFDIVFDENPALGRRALAWWPVIRAMQEPRLQAVLPARPSLANDLDEVPLQVADLTAWLSLADTRGANPFAWLRQHLSGIGKAHSVQLGLKEVELMFKRTPIPPELEWKRVAASNAAEETFVMKGAKSYVPKPPKQKRQVTFAELEPRTVKALQESSRDLLYEIRMLRGTAKLLMERTYPRGETRYAVLESFTIHARSLIEFFFPPPKLDKRGIYVWHYIDRERWATLAPPTIPPVLKEVVTRTGTEIAHLSFERLKKQPDEWHWDVPGIWSAFNPVLDAFCREVDHKLLYVSWIPMKVGPLMHSRDWEWWTLTEKDGAAAPLTDCSTPSTANPVANSLSEPATSGDTD